MKEMYLLRTVPLAKKTRDAWKEAGVRIVKRKNIASYFKEGNPEDVIINLGWRKQPAYDNVWNHADTVKAVSRPLDLRETLGNSLLPPYPEKGDGFWIKQPGMGGKGKVFVQPAPLLDVPSGLKGDVQKHIIGREYRVNTVSDRIVQAHVKHGDVINGFEWEWCGVKGIAETGIISRTKSALDLIPYSETAILGWDWIIEDGTGTPYLLEINTSAGVNAATAQRIVDVIQNCYNPQPTEVPASSL